MCFIRLKCLKLTVAISRKIGQPNYGSRGATVGLETEIDSSLVAEPRQLHAQIAGLFNLASQSVDRELGSRGAAPSNLNGSHVDAEPRPATPAQLRAIYAIAKRHNLDLLAELSSRFGISCPQHLTLTQASRLIEVIGCPTPRAPSCP